MWQFPIEIQAICSKNRIIAPSAPLNIEARISYTSSLILSGFNLLVKNESMSPFTKCTQYLFRCQGVSGTRACDPTIYSFTNSI